MQVWILLSLSLALSAGAQKSQAPLVVVDTPDGAALVNPKNGSLIPLTDLSRYEIDALGIGDPALLQKGDLADERRRAARKILAGCSGDIKCWREGMARWEAAGQKKVKKGDEAEKKRILSLEAPPDGLSREDRIKERCLEYGDRPRLTPSEHAFYDRYCI